MVKFIFQQTEPILDEDVLGCLNNLHEKFVLVPFGKASNDVAIIFKKIYLKKKKPYEIGIYGYNSTHITIQTNVLVMSFLIIFNFVKV